MFPGIEKRDELKPMSKSYAFTPRLVQETAAAHYLGMSPSKLRSLGLPRRVSDGNKLYDIRDLDAFADALPYEGQETWEKNEETDLAFEIAAE